MSKEEIAEILLNTNSVSISPVNPFKYANGMLSPIYTNCRSLISFPKERKIIADSFIEFIDKEIGRENIDVIVGTASSGISLATFLTEKLKLPIAYIRTAPKKHGKEKQVEGLLRKGMKALLITDILSTEQDVPVCVNVLKENGCEIIYCLAVMNNNVNIVDMFLDSEKIKYSTLTDLKTLLMVAQLKDRLSEADKENIVSWMENPEQWYKTREEKNRLFLDKNKMEVAGTLLKIQAVTLNTKTPYRFTSGILSPVYTDCRLLMSYPKEWQFIIDSAINVIVNEIGMQNIDIIGGTATAGISHATYIAQKLGLPMIYIKSENGNNKIEGFINRDDRILIIEDLISTGKSSMECVKAVRSAGGIVSNCLSIFNYGMEEARITFEKENIKLISLTDMDALLGIATSQNYIKNGERETIIKWIADSANWGRKMGFQQCQP